MKMYKKSELTLVNGMFVDKDMNVIRVNPNIVHEANDLETLAQKTDYLMAQPPASPMPTLDGFERKSSKDTGVKFNTTTPLMDAKMQETMDLMDELDDMALADKANAMLDDFKHLIEFAQNDYVVSEDGIFGCTNAFDMPTLGSVLELTVDDICNVVALAVGMKPDGTKDDEGEGVELHSIAIPLKDVETIEKFQDFLESVVKPDVQAKDGETTEAAEE